MNSDKILLEFITRLTYNIDGLSGELKLYFSQVLSYHFSKTLSKEQIQNIENKKASKKFENNEEILKIASGFSSEDRIWCIAATQLLQSQAEKMDDRVVSRRIGLVTKNLITIFNLESESDKITEKKRRIENEIHEFQSRQIIKIPARIWPLTLDFGVRCLFLLSFSYLGLDKSYLAGVNVFLIPIFIWLLVYTESKRHSKVNQLLLTSYGGAIRYKIEYRFSASQYTCLATYLGISVFISYLLPDKLHLLAFFGLIGYYIIYLIFFRLGILKENDLVKQLEYKELNAEILTLDENDEVIVSLETKFNSSTSRLEAYVLESALFGALTFSGFLQIMATDLVSFKDLENFANSIFTTSQAFISFEWDQFELGLKSLSNKISLFCLVSVESLICSIFFLGVIAARLRFSDIADRVRTAINLAKAYNAKEEMLNDEEQVMGEKGKRLETLTAKVNEQLHEASLIFREIRPVMMYMQYFRNAGILVFLAILISSSLFITSVLGWAFLALVFATYFYFNRAIVNHKFKVFFLNFRIQFMRRGFWLFGIALLLQVLGFILRIFFHVRETTPLFALSYFLMGLYIFAWLIFAAHVDEQFGEIENAQHNLSRHSRWGIVKNTMAVLILICGIALGFKFLQLAGANEMLSISLTALALLMYFVGYYLTKIRWLGILFGNVIAIASIGILFKILHLTGANEMLLISFCAFCIIIPIIIWKRNIFHLLLLRFCLAGFLICVYYFPLYNVTESLSIAYQHETLEVKEIKHVLSANNLFPDEKSLDNGIQMSDWYINQFGARFGFTGIHRYLTLNYQDFAASILDPDDVTLKIDSTLLPLALKAVREEHKILNLFDYKVIPNFEFAYAEGFELEANLLMTMGKKEEAIQLLENALQTDPPERLKKLWSDRLNSIKSQSQ